ncbi:hypothetical protein MTO96_031538 [Rhipicephalus appendiculatus]
MRTPISVVRVVRRFSSSKSPAFLSGGDEKRAKGLSCPLRVASTAISRLEQWLYENASVFGRIARLAAHVVERACGGYRASPKPLGRVQPERGL